MNYKSWFITSALATTFLVTGCGADEAMDIDKADQFNAAGYYDSEKKQEMTNERNGLHDNNYLNTTENYNYMSVKDDTNEETDRLGYTRHKEEQVENDIRYGVMQREHVSDLITRMILQGEGIEDAATLVTASEALIAYTPNGELSREKAADLAKKTALSVLPRYYEVYVTDEPNFHQDLATLSKLSTKSDNYNSSLESTIEQMRQSPQGESMYNDETKSHKDKRNM
ncbi:YhcN/YlaJ family sporulation lipoprotein [Pontibacillus litoralis]|uniref:Sporulation protein n=1 Tax=Pontibacillus litoralis JSM 072002 TaxID=1385512 RepID=A0A0A5G0Q7_9BACI|nr:YhcN/YlaJ family sporulation lipoprotein [Pontibacillus litoralis]KGX86696.1 hypothetical protein N784_03615 [Pontibacillus litoralis JSM 072002]